MKKDMSVERSKRNNNVSVAKEVKEFNVVEEEELDELEDPEITLTYDEFMDAIEEDIVVKCRTLLEKAMNEVGFGPDQIDKVIMTGGSCKNPFIKEMLIDRFGKDKVDVSQNDFDLLVTKGAAIFANEIGNGIQTLEMGEITMHDIGVKVKVEDNNGKLVSTNHIVIKKETPLPLTNKHALTVTTSEDSMNELVFAITENGEVKSKLVLSNLPQLPRGCVEVELDFNVRDTCLLFGDGEGAVLLKKSNNNCMFYSTSKTDEDMIIEAPGLSQITTEDTLTNFKLLMKGTDVFKFALDAFSDCLEDLSNKGISVNDIDMIIPHQANKRIILSVSKRYEIDEEKFFLNIEKYGNTSAASIAIALDEAYKSGRIKKGMKILLVGFGSGLSWGYCFLEI